VKIWTFSDLHLRDANASFDRIFPAGVPDADVCVCAGDLVAGDPEAGVEWVDRHVGGHMPTILVMGNHEFYNRSASMQRLRELAGRAAVRTRGRVSVLDDMGITIGGTRFLGSTLWYSLEIFGRDPESMARSARGAASLNDRNLIRRDDASTSRWEPADARRQHLQSRRWLEAELAASQLPTVVVTHHAPHPSSIADQYKDDWATAGFVSDLSDVIERYRPVAWLHGHTHTSFDYEVGSTRVTCNPRGYGKENSDGFDPEMVIHLGDPKPRPRGL
jgi:Icc-related predicted phosphoesterase